MDSPFAFDVGRSNGSVKNVDPDNLSIVVKQSVFGCADNRSMLQQCVTGSPEQYSFGIEFKIFSLTGCPIKGKEPVCSTIYSY